jgi:deoxyribodipyrimidine photo-lyase
VNSILWFRRDLRISDHPALNAAADEAKKNGGVVVPVFILDKALIGGAGSKRLAYLGDSLRALDKSLGGYLGRGLHRRVEGATDKIFSNICAYFGRV